MNAKDLFSLYKQNKEKFNKGLIEEEEYELNNEKITEHVDKLLDTINEEDMIWINEDDKDLVLSTDGQTYKGKDCMICDDRDGFTHSSSELFDFLSSFTTNNMRVRTIAIAAGARYAIMTDRYTEDDSVETFYF